MIYYSKNTALDDAAMEIIGYCYIQHFKTNGYF